MVHRWKSCSCGNPCVAKRKWESIILETYPRLEFTLKFEDGKPDVRVYTQNNYSANEEIVKMPWWKRKQFKQYTIETFTYNTIYYVNCGEFTYTLTDEEFTKLYNETQSSFKAMVEHRIKARETETIDKINARIARHTKEDDKTT